MFDTAMISIGLLKNEMRIRLSTASTVIASAGTRNRLRCANCLIVMPSFAIP